MNLDQLQRQHEAIETLAAQFLSVIADDRLARPLGTLRWQLARELMAHLALEDRIFYPSMQRQPHALLRDTAARLQVEMAPLAASFSSYMSRWSDDRITREWRDFCRESRQMIDAILNRMHTEEKLLVPLLTEAGIEPPLKRAS